MNNLPLVSIVMPVYNSFDFVRSENQNFLIKAIESLINQSYSNIELIILDNQSTDNTPVICKKFAKQDKRIKYIIDTKKRYPEGGISHAGTFAKGKYCMIANDDDIWNKNYIETLVDYMESKPDIDMCYTNGNFINIFNQIIGKIICSEEQVYTNKNSTLSNLARYLQNRNPIPISFGLFKTSVFKKMIPYDDFDNLKANVDNLFISKLIINNIQIAYIDKCLFSYRIKKRSLNPKKVSDMPTLNQKDLIGFYYLRHQFYFYNKFMSLFCDVYKPSQNKLDFIRSVAINSLIKHSSNFSGWLSRSLNETTAENRILLKKIIKEYDKIKKINDKDFPKLGNFESDCEDNIRFEPVLNNNLLKKSKFILEQLFLILNIYDKNIILADIIKMIKTEIDLINNRLENIKILMDQIPDILSSYSKTKYQEEDVSYYEPQISVITTSYNLAPFVEETMRSVSNQIDASFEHIVIDGDSKDESINLLKKYPNIVLISEKDEGYPDAFWKGLKIAKGKYILQCAISDGYATKKWLKKCIDVMEKNKDISLVWGFAGRLSEESKYTGISRPQFHYNQAPSKVEMFNYWLKTSFIYPEGNLCVRKNVILQCYPTIEQCKKNILDWLEFSYRFNRFGFISYHIPILANFGRTHGNQLGERLGINGNLKGKYLNFKRKISLYRIKLIFGLNKHNFIDSNNNKLNLSFNRSNFTKDYINFMISNFFKIDKKYYKIQNYIKFAKRFLYKIQSK